MPRKKRLKMFTRRCHRCTRTWGAYTWSDSCPHCNGGRPWAFGPYCSTNVA
jgi:rRNA maturation protein Nop10